MGLQVSAQAFPLVLAWLSHVNPDTLPIGQFEQF